MADALKNVVWRFPLDETTQDKRASRMSLSPGKCDEIVGVDLRTQGGLKVHPGFREIYPGPTTSTNWTAVTDFYPITLQKDTTDAYSGFVMRGTYSGTAQIRFVYYYYNGSSWVWGDVQITDTSGYQSGRMDVALVGRLAYIFVEGQTPILIYFTSSGTFTIQTNTGPGVQPGGPDAPWGEMGLEVVYGTSAPASQGGETPAPLTPGVYSFCYQLYDTVTGRKSQLSKVKTISAIGTTTANPNAYIRYTINGLGSPPNLPTGANNSSYNQVRVYRSISVEAIGSFWANRFMFLEKKITIPSGYNPPTTYCRFTNEQLTEQEPYDAQAIFDSTMPKGGSAISYKGTLFVGVQNYETTGDAQQLGEIRWSVPTSISPELFPPINRVTPEMSVDVPIRFLKVGDSLIGLSANYMNLIHKAGKVVTFPVVHTGYGIANRNAAISMDNSGYVITSQGLVAVDPQGTLSPLNAIDKLLFEDWSGDSASLVMTMDPPMGCLMLLNPIKEKIICFWGNTRAISELHNVPFSAAGVGVAPSTDVTSNLYRRALFVTNLGRVYRVDDQYSKNHKALLDVDGITSLKQTITNTVTPTTTALSVAYESTLTANRLIGNYIGIVSGAAQGQMAKITGVTINGTTSVNLTLSSSTSINRLTTAPAVGDKFVISPVLFRARTWPIGLFDENQIADSFRGRTAQTLSCNFQAVSGSLSTDVDVANYFTRIYKGLSSTPISSVARVVDGSGTAVASIVDGVGSKSARFGTVGFGGSILFPEVEIFASDLTFRLIGFSVRGTIDHSDNRG